MIPTPPELAAFLDLFEALRAAKPNDRSARDRAFAVVLTELEKCYAYFVVYCATEDGQL